jgi:hypothetical protein
MQSNPILRASVAISALFGALLSTGCDNVGRAFDPVIDPTTNPQDPASSTVQVPRDGADFRDGRPLIREVYPRGGGWPVTVPVVVEFSESINEASVEPTTPGGRDGKVILRIAGSDQPIPTSYDWFAQGRLLVMRPAADLSDQGQPEYEVVMLPEVRDLDGVRFSGSEEQILATFTVDQDPAVEDGELLAIYPRDNARDVQHGPEFVAVFNRAANTNTLVPQNLSLRPSGGAPIAGAIETPLTQLTPGGGEDGRIVTITPNAPLLGEVVHEFVVTSGVTFGTGGVLQFNGRTPYSVFTTGGVPKPTAVRLKNPDPATFVNKINLQNFATAQVEVDLPSGALAGDRLVVRIYGIDSQDAEGNELAFVEREVEVPAAGAQAVTADFTAGLGSASRPVFAEGGIEYVAQLRRGQTHSGALLGDDDGRFDLTRPTVVTIGPPTGENGTDIYVDTQHLAFFGTASEQLGGGDFTDGFVNVELFGSSPNGDFIAKPIELGRLVGPRSYSLTVRDAAGNASAGAYAGDLFQRGLITGANADTLTVEAYDDATLAPIEGVTVLVDPGVPVLPAAGRVTATTNGAGQALFGSLALGARTITLLKDGYDLVTFYETAAGFVSLPMRQTSDDTATLRGTLVFPPEPGRGALVGCQAFADETLLGVPTLASAVNAIPQTPIRPNRPLVVSAIAGALTGPTRPFFTWQGCNLCGVTLIDPASPIAGPGSGQAAQATLLLLDAAQLQVAQEVVIGTLPAPLGEDFGSTGVDLGNLVGGAPGVRSTVSLLGFAGQHLIGTGEATSTGGTAFAIEASYSRIIPATAGEFFDGWAWIATEARDTGGRSSRVRALLNYDFANGTVTTTDALDAAAVPGITAVATAGSPSIDVDDVLTPGLTAFGHAVLEVQATDPAGRSWRILREDGDPAGGSVSLQFPDLTGQVGLATGDWSMRATARFFLDRYGIAGDFALTEMLRQEALMSRGAAVSITVTP